MAFQRFVYGLSTICPRFVYGFFRPLSTPDKIKSRVQINVLTWKHVNLTVEEEQGYIYLLICLFAHLYHIKTAAITMFDCCTETLWRSPRNRE